AALAGHNHAVQNLADDLLKATPAFDAGTISGSFDGSEYRCTTSLIGLSRARVECAGWARSNDTDSVLFNIHSEYEMAEITSGIAESAPDFLNYAVLSEDNLAMNGNITGDICEICVDGTEAMTLNADMHTNGNLHVTGNSASVRGFGTYGTYGSSNPTKALDNTFQPYYNPSGANSTHRAETINIPALNVPVMALAMEPDSVTNGDAVLSSDIDFGGTREDPYIWHIKGDLTASGNAQVEGYVMFLVDDDVTFSGTVDAGEFDGYEGGDESSVAFYVGDDVFFSGTVEVWGQIFAGDALSFQGTPDVYGSITANSVSFGGTVSIFYRPASPGLTTYWNSETNTRLRRLAYSEF
ncbi:MAG TPA: hypothetical protein VKP65_21545, partial [Rhodothermales bacterium]|nr:hypothetical protein [Rhodothermales bacterium]